MGIGLSIPSCCLRQGRKTKLRPGFEHGYDAAFLCKNNIVDLPRFSKELLKDVLNRNDLPATHFRDKYYTNYIHFSIATNKSLRQPIVTALNIDQKLIKSVKRKSWKLDPQVGKYQLDNSYFKNNSYDRGHLVRRSAAAWGETKEEAKAASDATMVYSNVSLQHENFNQDEWLYLENWVKRLKLDSTDKISCFSGPIYTSRHAADKYIGDPPAKIPTAFFKVVCYIDENGKLGSRAFILPQDKEAISSKNANKHLDLCVYQVPISIIQEETGIMFSKTIIDSNIVDDCSLGCDEFYRISREQT